MRDLSEKSIPSTEAEQRLVKINRTNVIFSFMLPILWLRNTFIGVIILL